MATKQFKEVTKRLNIEPFNYAVFIIASNNVRHSAEKRGIQVGKPWYAMHCGVVDQPVSFIFVPFSADVRSIAHESTHCTWHIMKTLGAEFEDEIMAYTTGHLSGEIHKLLRKHRPVRRHKNS